MNPIYGGGFSPYNPMIAAQQRLAELEAQYAQYGGNQPMNNPMNNPINNPVFTQNPQSQVQMTQQPQNFLKCRAVTSIDEAKAAMIDLDGSIFVFTDFGNKHIYTKQINLDGTATLNTYTLEEIPVSSPVSPTVKTENTTKFVEQQEFIDRYNELYDDIDRIFADLKAVKENINNLSIVKEKTAQTAEKGGKK